MPGEFGEGGEGDERRDDESPEQFRRRLAKEFAEPHEREPEETDVRSHQRDEPRIEKAEQRPDARGPDLDAMVENPGLPHGSESADKKESPEKDELERFREYLREEYPSELGKESARQDERIFGESARPLENHEHVTAGDLRKGAIDSSDQTWKQEDGKAESPKEEISQTLGTEHQDDGSRSEVAENVVESGRTIEPAESAQGRAEVSRPIERESEDWAERGTTDDIEKSGENRDIGVGEIGTGHLSETVPKERQESSTVRATRT